MTILTSSSLDSIQLDKSGEGSELSERKLLGQMIKNKEYLQFLETVETFDFEAKGTKTHIAKKIRKLNFEDIARDPGLTRKLIVILTTKHPTLIDKKVLQRGLIKKLQAAIQKENTILQLVCLKLIHCISDDDLEKKLETTSDQQTVSLIRSYKALKEEGIEFSIKSNLSISVKPKKNHTSQLIKIHRYFLENKWNQIHLNLECSSDNPESKLDSDELQRLLMVLQKDNSPYFSLKFKGQQLSPKLMKELASLIQTSSTIAELNVKDCQIKLQTLKQLTRIWDKKNDPLTKLNLSNNPLKEGGIKLLLGKIPADTQLSILKLQSTEINKSALTELCQQLSSRKQPITIKLSEDEIEEKDREFISYLCTPKETIEFVKNSKPVEEIIVSSEIDVESSEENYNASVYCVKNRSLKEATEKDLQTFEAVFLPDKPSAPIEFITEMVNYYPDLLKITLRCQGIPSENMRFLIDNDQIIIIAYWTTYSETSAGYKREYEFYYEEKEFKEMKLIPSTFTFEQVGDSTIKITIGKEQ
jgi:hypothetical protein